MSAQRNIRRWESPQRVSRKQALSKIRQLLRRDWESAEARYWIELFQVDAEELSEAGVGYEILKNLEKTCVHWRI